MALVTKALSGCASRTGHLEGYSEQKARFVLVDRKEEAVRNSEGYREWITGNGASGLERRKRRWRCCVASAEPMAIPKFGPQLQMGDAYIHAPSRRGAAPRGARWYCHGKGIDSSLYAKAKGLPPRTSEHSALATMQVSTAIRGQWNVPRPCVSTVLLFIRTKLKRALRWRACGSTLRGYPRGGYARNSG